MADTVKRGGKVSTILPEVQKHVMKDSARLNTYAQMRAEVVDLLRAEAVLHMPMVVKRSTDWPHGKGKDERKKQVR